MALYVTAGAKMKCSFGSSPAPIIVLPTDQVMLGGPPEATIMDFTAIKNIPPFGMCSSLTNPVVAAATAKNAGVLQPMPCVPVPIMPWVPGKPNVLIGGKPACLDNCRTACSWLGMIEFSDAGQTSTQTGAGSAAEAGEAYINALKSALKESGLDKALGLEEGKAGTCEHWTKLSAEIGTGTSHPADVAEGHFYTRSTDFDVKGIIPLAFKRIYYSYSTYKGPLGLSWHHSYDMALAFDEEEGLAALRLPDGRLTGFDIPEPGDSSFDRTEKLWLHHHKDGYFYVSDKKGLIYRFTDEIYANPNNKGQNHPLQSISNRNGYSMRFAYHKTGVLKRITDTAGRVFDVMSDKNGRITEIIAPSSESSELSFVIASYEYDKKGRLIKQTNAEGHSMKFEYNKDNQLIQETWRNGLNWYIVYDKPGSDAKVLEVMGDDGIYHHKLDYVAPDCTEVTDSLDAKTIYYHEKGLVTKRVDPNGAETVFQYNDAHELIWSKDPLDNFSVAEYDEWGNLTSKLSPDNGIVRIQYDNAEFPYLPTSATDKAGGQWQWIYDQQGNLIKRINPLSAATEFEYSDGLLTTVAGPLGQKTHLSYDTHHNLSEVLSPDEGRNRWLYDNLGECIRYENAKNGVTEYEYNLLGEAIRIRLPDGNIRQLRYDAEGNVIEAKDKDRYVTFTYRGVNKLASRTERGATLRFRYDTEDRLCVVENEAREQYRFLLDEVGNVTEETGFDGLSRQYTRDIAGRVTSVLRPDDTKVSYEYDEAGRVTKVTYSDGTEESYAYRTDGLLIRATNAHAEVKLERDVLGRVVKETCNGETIKSRYDIANNRTNITSSLGADIFAEYNLMGDVVSLAGGGWQTAYERDVFGLETGRSFGGGIQSHTKRDRLGRVTGHQIEKDSHKLTEKSYLWGSNDQLLSAIIDGKETRFEYDGWGNLSKTFFGDGQTEYRNPDISGNLFESLDRMDRQYAKGGQLVKTKDWEYKYDRLGNLVRKKDIHGATWRYEWNAAGMLVKVNRPDAKEVTFKYDALGRRIEKQFADKVTRWVWDGNVPLHEQQLKETAPNLAYEKMPLITWVFEEGTFIPAAKITDTQKLSIATNYMGTPEAMYAEDGQAVWKCELNSYGKVRSYEGDTKTACPFRYQGQYEDAETGLYYNRFRYYSPEEGVYISQDPIGLFSGNFSFYSYVINLNILTDPLGLVGGSYLDAKEAGKTSHHMPSKQATINAKAYTNNPKLPTPESGPAITMTNEDHYKTGSYGGNTKFRDEQQAFIENGQFHEAMRMDIIDIKIKTSAGIIKNDYTNDMIQAVNYAENQGFITNEQAKDLINQCK